MKAPQTTFAALALTCAPAPALALAGEWKFLPIMDADYRPDLTVSLVGGVMDPVNVRKDSYVGLEVAANCGLLQTPTGVVRTKLSYGRFDKDGTELRVFEVNPRWTLPIAKKLTAGFGPGIGWVRAEAGSRETDKFAWQLGADLDYRVGRLNLGLGARWQDTVDKTVSPGNKGAENWLVQAKVGVSF